MRSAWWLHVACSGCSTCTQPPWSMRAALVWDAPLHSVPFCNISLEHSAHLVDMQPLQELGVLMMYCRQLPAKHCTANLDCEDLVPRSAPRSPQRVQCKFAEDRSKAPMPVLASHSLSLLRPPCGRCFTGGCSWWHSTGPPAPACRSSPAS